ncbi:ATP-dependent permease, partial [Giardia duodenalis]
VEVASEGSDDHLKASHRPLCGDCLKDVHQMALESVLQDHSERCI